MLEKGIVGRVELSVGSGITSGHLTDQLCCVFLSLFSDGSYKFFRITTFNNFSQPSAVRTVLRDEYIRPAFSFRHNNLHSLQFGSAFSLQRLGGGINNRFLLPGCLLVPLCPDRVELSPTAREVTHEHLVLTGDPFANFPIRLDCHIQFLPVVCQLSLELTRQLR